MHRQFLAEKEPPAYCREKFDRRSLQPDPASVAAGKAVIEENALDVEYELKIPSGEIKIPIQLWIEEDGMTTVTMDFDAEKSVKFHK